jgi:stage II sporulation protein D
MVLLILTPVLYLKKQLHVSKHPPDIPVILFASKEGRLYRFNLEEYLIGVVAAEMPARFFMEALKAQSVAARTLAVRRLRKFGGHGCRHYGGADFCDDPAENQAWLSDASLKRKWDNRDFPIYYRKIKQAVDETRGIIIICDNQPIDAVFHSTCGIGTAAAGEVWNYNVPYLQSESCGFDSESTRFRNNYSFTWNQLSQYLKIPEASIRKIKVISRSATGRVLRLTLGNYRISGDQFRKMIGLASTCFTWKVERAGMHFSSIGYGHGVGMCQYGANGMAKQGRTYRQILRHYYRGVKFGKIKFE